VSTSFPSPAASYTCFPPSSHHFFPSVPVHSSTRILLVLSSSFHVQHEESASHTSFPLEASYVGNITAVPPSCIVDVPSMSVQGREEATASQEFSLRGSEWRPHSSVADPPRRCPFGYSALQHRVHHSPCFPPSSARIATPLSSKTSSAIPIFELVGFLLSVFGRRLLGNIDTARRHGGSVWWRQKIPSWCGFSPTTMT